MSVVSVPIPSVSSAYSPTMTMDKEKSDSSGMFQGNAKKKPAWNRLSPVESGIKPVIGALSWPSLSETTKAAPCSNKPSSDSLKSLAGDGSSPSSVSSLSQGSSFLAGLERKERTFNKPIMDQGFVEQAAALTISKVTNDTAAQLSGQGSLGSPSPCISSRDQNQRGEFAPQSHVDTQNQDQWKSNRNQNVSHPSHQSYGGRRNQEHVNHNWNIQRNFNEQGRFSQPSRGCTPGFIRPPPPLMPSFYARHMPVQQPFYQVFRLAPPMHYPHRMNFIEPPPVLFPFQETTKILNQVQYYLSEDNLPSDV